MKSKLIKVLFVLALTSCGGGGGGGGGGEGESAPTGVRVLHGAIDYAPVQLVSTNTGTEVVTGGYFAENTLYGRLPEGTQKLTMFLKNSPTNIVDVKELTVEDDQHYSFLLFGNELQIGLATSIISDNPGEIPDGSAAIKVVHALVGASKLNASFSGGQSETGIGYGAASSYVMVPAGIANVNISRASDGSRVSSITNEFAAGKAYTILMTGEIELFTVARILED